MAEFVLSGDYWQAVLVCSLVESLYLCRGHIGSLGHNILLHLSNKVLLAQHLSPILLKLIDRLFEILFRLLLAAKLHKYIVYSILQRILHVVFSNRKAIQPCLVKEEFLNKQVLQNGAAKVFVRCDALRAHNLYLPLQLREEDSLTSNNCYCLVYKTIVVLLCSGLLKRECHH